MPYISSVGFVTALARHSRFQHLLMVGDHYIQHSIARRESVPISSCMVRRVSYLLFKSTATSAFVWLLSSTTRALQTSRPFTLGSCYNPLLRRQPIWSSNHLTSSITCRTIMSSTPKDDANDETTPRRSKRGTKGVVQKENINEPQKKKAKGRPKKIKLEEEGGSPTPKKAKGKPKKVKDDEDGKPPPAKKAKGRPKKSKLEEDTSDSESPKKKAKGRPKAKSGDDKASTPSPKANKKPAKRAKAADHQRLTERDELTKLWDAKEHEDTSYSKSRLSRIPLMLCRRMLTLLA